MEAVDKKKNVFFTKSFVSSVFCGGWVLLVLLVLGAHFFRASEYGLVLCVLGIMGFLFTKKLWQKYTVAFFLFWGAWEWADSAFFLGTMRNNAGLPWIRATLILGSVALVTLLAGVHVFRKAKKSDEENNSNLPMLQAGIFIGTFLLLLFVSQSVGTPLLLLERYLPVLGTVQIFFMSWYAAFIFNILRDNKKSRRVRKAIWLLFSVVFFGQFALGLLGMDKMLMTGNLHIPIPAFIIYAPVFRGSFSMMPILVLISVFLLGSAWCSTLCYFGGMDAFAASNKSVKPLPTSWVWLVKYGRIVTLCVGIVVAFILRLLGLSLEIAILLAVIFGIFSLVFMLLFSRKYNTLLHCTTFCPMGVVVNLLAKLSPWRVRVSKSLCDNCGACEKVCQYRAITEQSRQSGGVLLSCSMCRDCFAVCKHKAISLHCLGLHPGISQNIFVALLVVMHVLFLSFARV